MKARFARISSRCKRRVRAVSGTIPTCSACDPDLWADEFAFLSQPGQADIQSDLLYDHRTNVESYPKMAGMDARAPAAENKWDLVGAGRFERPTPCAQGRCATRLRYAPTFDAPLILAYPSKNQEWRT
jgi:hypothetical protein